MDLLVDRITAWVKLQPDILALYLYGSVAEGRANVLSDLDIGLLVRAELTKQEIWRLEDRWASQWPEVVDLRVLNHAPVEFQYDVTAHGQRLWCADEGVVADYESLIWRKYWDEEPRLKAAITSHPQQVAEARDAIEQQEYQSTLDKVAEVHRRVREAAAGTIRRLSS
jgi:predicted nucleotidyltransferase